MFAGGRALREILIDRRRLAIGRRPYNDLLLDDLTVSGEHAIIHTIDGQSIIHDLKSRNGTLVNGRPVMQCDLNDGDAIEVGIYRLEYRSEPLPGIASWTFAYRQTATNRDGVRTSAWTPGGATPGGATPDAMSSAESSSGRDKPMAPAAQVSGDASGPGNFDGTTSADKRLEWPGKERRHFRRDDPRFGAPNYGAAHAVPRTAVLRWLGGDDAGREQLIDRPIVSIRNSLGQVAVVGRRHSGWCITHMEGLSYPLVNGEAIGLAAHPLRENDLIELAGTIIQFSLS